MAGGIGSGYSVDVMDAVVPQPSRVDYSSAERTWKGRRYDPQDVVRELRSRTKLGVYEAFRTAYCGYHRLSVLDKSHVARIRADHRDFEQKGDVPFYVLHAVFGS